MLGRTCCPWRPGTGIPRKTMNEFWAMVAARSHILYAGHATQALSVFATVLLVFVFYRMRASKPMQPEDLMVRIAVAFAASSVAMYLVPGWFFGMFFDSIGDFSIWYSAIKEDGTLWQREPLGILTYQGPRVFGMCMWQYLAYCLGGISGICVGILMGRRLATLVLPERERPE